MLQLRNFKNRHYRDLFVCCKDPPWTSFFTVAVLLRISFGGVNGLPFWIGWSMQNSYVVGVLLRASSDHKKCGAGMRKSYSLCFWFVSVFSISLNRDYSKTNCKHVFYYGLLLLFAFFNKLNLLIRRLFLTSLQVYLLLLVCVWKMTALVNHVHVYREITHTHIPCSVCFTNVSQSHISAT